jgi:hypothetical protein
LTGKIRCSIGGFAFQGHTTKSKGIVYRRYIDDGWSAKLVCDFYGINKEKIEGFAISAVQEIVNDNQIFGRLEAALQQKISEESRQSLSKNQMEFCLNFDVRFSEATISEKKVLLQKCLSEIIIDRDRKVAVVRVREIPAIHPDVANLLQNKKAHTEVVCARE